MTIKETLRADLTEAIRGRNEITSSTIRMVLTAITNEEVAGKEARVLSDEEIIVVLSREAKKRREAAEAFEKTLQKVKRMNPQVAEYSIQMNYLELMLELPWYQYTKDNFNLKKVKEILDDDDFFGIVCVTITPPSNLFIPVLLDYDLESQKCVAHLNKLVGKVFTSIELKVAIQAGYVLNKIHRFDKYHKRMYRNKCIFCWCLSFANGNGDNICFWCLSGNFSDD